jgi:hypothetical protein
MTWGVHHGLWRCPGRCGDLHVLHGHRPIHGAGSVRRQGVARPEDAAGVEPFFKPEKYFEVRKALEQAGRTDLIGGGCDSLIPAQPPKEGLEARRERANEEVRGDHSHTVANPKKGEPAGERGLPNQGYRPGRTTARRQDKNRK